MSKFKDETNNRLQVINRRISDLETYHRYLRNELLVRIKLIEDYLGVEYVEEERKTNFLKKSRKQK